MQFDCHKVNRNRNLNLLLEFIVFIILWLFHYQFNSLFDKIMFQTDRGLIELIDIAKGMW